jgi:hypothetical protein
MSRQEEKGADGAGEEKEFAAVGSLVELTTVCEQAAGAPSLTDHRAAGYGCSTTRMGDVTAVHVVVRDHRRKRFSDVPDPNSTNGSALHATLTGPTATIHPTIAPTRGDPGLYTVRYRPTEEGPHLLRIFLHGKEVDGSPLRVTVKEEDCDREAFRRHLPEVRGWMTNGMLPWDPDLAPLWETQLHGNGPYPIHRRVPREVAGRPFDASSAKLMVDAVEQGRNGTGRLLNSTGGPSRTVEDIPTDDGDDESEHGDREGAEERSGDDHDDVDDSDGGPPKAHDWRRHDANDAYQGYLYRKQATLLHSRISMLKSSFTNGSTNTDGDGKYMDEGDSPPALPTSSLRSLSSRTGVIDMTAVAVYRSTRRRAQTQEQHQQRRGGVAAIGAAASTSASGEVKGTTTVVARDGRKYHNRFTPASWAGMDPY